MSEDLVKMEQEKSNSCKERKIILNVFKYFRKNYPDKGVSEIVKYTSNATGCSEKSIFRYRKEETSPGGLEKPSKTRVRKNTNINSNVLIFDESVREGIKCIINDLKSKSIIPTVSTILENVNMNDTLPSFSFTTLSKLLIDMGFEFEKDKTANKPVIVGSEEIEQVYIKTEDSEPNDPSNSGLQKDTAVEIDNIQPMEHSSEIVP